MFLVVWCHLSFENDAHCEFSAWETVPEKAVPAHHAQAGEDVADFTGSQPMFIRPLSDPWTASGTRHLLSTPTSDWETVGGAVNEGDPLDSSSWVKTSTPIFQSSDANGVFGPGHNGFFTSPDGTEDWMVYHANTAGGGCDINRTTRAQKFTWNADGTPNFGTPLALGAPMRAPSGEPAS